MNKVKELKEHVMSFVLQLPKKPKEFKVHHIVRESNSMKKTSPVLIKIHTIIGTKQCKCFQVDCKF